MQKIHRELFGELKAHLNAREISLIVGPRQAGKTTLMTEVKAYLDQKGEKTIFLNLDYPESRIKRTLFGIHSQVLQEQPVSGH